LSNQNRKEVNRMEKQYEAPQLVLVGRADEVVLGAPSHGLDGDDGFSIDDFEYEQD
jgi:hypothetical protein